MRKVGIITYHFANNFGAALQAFALQEALSQLDGVESCVVDYRNRFIRFTDTVRLAPITSNPRELASGFSTMGDRIGRMGKFKSFSAHNFRLTRQYGSFSALERDVPACDAFVCGSDQIWNSTITAGIARPYYAAFRSPSQRAFSYAVSLGGKTFEGRQRDTIIELLEQLDDISVRESDGVAYLQSLLPDRQVHRHIDPVFLLDPDYWRTIARRPLVDLPDRFITLYMMQPDPTLYARAQELKSQTGLPIVEISRYGLTHEASDYRIIDMGPAEFVWLFAHAEWACTNSFHGLAFSLIFAKPFSLLASKRFSTRISGLLEVLGIDAKPSAGSSLLVNEVPSDLGATIAREREASLSYLERNIRTSHD